MRLLDTDHQPYYLVIHRCSGFKDDTLRSVRQSFTLSHLAQRTELQTSPKTYHRRSIFRDPLIFAQDHIIVYGTVLVSHESSEEGVVLIVRLPRVRAGV